MQECKREELPNFTVTGEGLITAKQCRHWQMCEQKQRQQIDFVVSGRDAALPPRPFPSGARGPAQSLGSLRKENLFCPSTETQTQGLRQILVPTWLYWARGSPAAAHGSNSQPSPWVACPKPKICARHSHGQGWARGWGSSSHGCPCAAFLWASGGGKISMATEDSRDRDAAEHIWG